MAFQPIRDEEKRRVRFEFDSERGLIRHRSRGGRDQDYRIEVREGGKFRLEPVQDTPHVDVSCSRG